MDQDSMQRFFEGVVEPKVISEAYQDMVNGASSHTIINQDLFELQMGNVRASMSLKPGDGIETFKCNCSYHGKGLCKHFIFLFHAASSTIMQLGQQATRKTSISTLEYKVTRSKAITPELKALFKSFKKDFGKLWQAYLGCKTEKEAYTNEINLFITRNKTIKTCFEIARDARTKESIFGSFEIIIYSLFQFCKIIGYDNNEMLVPINYDFLRQLEILYHKAKAPEKQKMWDYIAKSLRQSNTNKLPENPVREIIVNFLLENYDSNKYYNDNLDLLDDLIGYAFIDGNKYLAEEWALEYLWHLGDSNIPEDELYHEYREWWDVPAIRLNYLEHCMEAHNHLTAYTIAAESLDDPAIFDEDEIAALHHILLGASFKTGKYNKTIEEAEILSRIDPETLLFETKHYLMSDQARWAKIEKSLIPIFEQAYKNTSASNSSIYL